MTQRTLLTQKELDAEYEALLSLMSGISTPEFIRSVQEKLYLAYDHNDSPIPSTMEEYMRNVAAYLEKEGNDIHCYDTVVELGYDFMFDFESFTPIPTCVFQLEQFLSFI